MTVFLNIFRSIDLYFESFKPYFVGGSWSICFDFLFQRRELRKSPSVSPHTYPTLKSCWRLERRKRFVWFCCGQLVADRKLVLIVSALLLFSCWSQVLSSLTRSPRRESSSSRRKDSSVTPWTTTRWPSGWRKTPALTRKWSASTSVIARTWSSWTALWSRVNFQRDSNVLWCSWVWRFSLCQYFHLPGASDRRGSAALPGGLQTTRRGSCHSEAAGNLHRQLACKALLLSSQKVPWTALETRREQFPEIWLCFVSRNYQVFNKYISMLD